MNQALNVYLREDERVLWQGSAERFPLLDSATKFQILCKWILTVALATGLLVGYFGKNEERSAGFIGLVLLAVAVMLLSPLAEQRSLMGQKYWMTNQRVMLMTRDKRFYYMELAELDGYQLVRDVAMQDCLVFGSCIFDEIHKQLRWRGCHPKVNLRGDEPQDCVAGMVFYCADNLDAAVDLLRPLNCPHAA